MKTHGTTPTFQLVRQELGNKVGSAIILQFLNKWKEKEQPEWRPSTPEDIETTAASLVRDIWQHTSRLMDEESAILRTAKTR